MFSNGGYVNSNSEAILHKNETIVPRATAEELQAFAATFMRDGICELIILGDRDGNCCEGPHSLEQDTGRIAGTSA